MNLNIERNQVVELQGFGLGAEEISASTGIEVRKVRQYMLADELGGLVPRALGQEAVGTLTELMRAAEGEKVRLDAAKELIRVRVDGLKSAKEDAGGINIAIINQELQVANNKLADIMKGLVSSLQKSVVTLEEASQQTPEIIDLPTE